MNIISRRVLNRSRRSTLAAGAALASLLTAGGARAACQLQELAEIDVEVHGSQFVLPAKIDDRPARLIVDTGAFNTSLFLDAANRLGLKPVALPGQTYGVGGAGGLWLTTANSVSIGGLTARNMTLFVTGRHSLGGDGLLGASFLLQRDIEFDLAHGKIRFFQPKGCAGDQVVYWGQAYAVVPMLAEPDRQLRVPVKVNGVLVQAQMDTGASASVLTLAAAASAGLKPGSPGVTEQGASRGLGPAAVRTYVGIFSTFSFGEETIRNSRLELADLFGADREVSLGSNVPRPAVDFPEMLLGADFFRSHRIYVAVSQRKVYVSYEGGPVFDTAVPAHRESTQDRAASGTDGDHRGGSS